MRGRGVPRRPPPAAEQTFEDVARIAFEVKLLEAAACGTAAAARLAEHLVEIETRSCARARTCRHRRIDAGMTEAVVSRALFLVRERFVGFLRLLEACLGVLPVLVAVRVVLHRELAIRLLDLVVRGAPRHTENIVEVALVGHL